MTDSKRKSAKAETEEPEVEAPQKPDLTGDESGETESGPDQELAGPAHEQGYTEETAKRNQADFGTPVPEASLEGRGVPGVS